MLAFTTSSQSMQRLATSNSNGIRRECHTNTMHKLQRKRRKNISRFYMSPNINELFAGSSSSSSTNLDFASSSSSSAFSSVLNSASSMILGTEFEPSQTFEPQVNAPALFSFLVIAVVFSLLQFRINSVRDASTRREEALSLLRQVKSEQLSLSPNDDNMDQRVQNAVKAYEVALKEELNLRTIIPGVRIVAPNDAARREQDIAAAKQFLDWDIFADEMQESGTISKSTSGSDDDMSNKNTGKDRDDVRNSLLMQSRRRFDGQDGETETSSTSSSSSSSPDEEKSMSNGAKAVLLTVALSQIALLFLLSLDPMSANNVFTEVAGTPTESLPLSSWTK